MIKSFFLLVLIYFLIHFAILPQCKIELIVFSKIPPNQNIFIAGNKPELGNWNPDKIPLNKINDSTWVKSFEFSTKEIIEFKFTKGSWDEEAFAENGKKSGNIILKVSADTTITFNISNWGNSKLKISGQITGNVKYLKDFESRNVLSRDIIVWLPPSYDSKPDKYYPVLYMQDGQNIFDPSTSSFGIDWQMDEVADSLIKAKAMDEIIIVGIYNTKDRGKEYNNTNFGLSYIKFLIEELKPFIDETYRTLPDRKNTAVGGSSSGGLISFIIAWNNPDVLSKAACISPAFKIADIDFVTPVKNYSGAKKDIKIYIDNGGVGLEEQLQPGIDEIFEALKQKGFVENKDLLFVKDTTAEHNESAWSKRVYRFLEFLFPVNQ
ncbi:MAG: alpha/beta hydrolase-fold protein [Ignavibacteriota bacterium]